MKNERISNPLTIVGIFSGITEIAGTTVIAFLSPELQAIFIWFVMVFPILLVVLFFLTWNFNPEVLYSPSDYRDDEAFLKMLTKKYKKDVENNIFQIEAMLVDAKKEIIDITSEALTDNSETSPIEMEAIVDDKINVIIDKLDETKYTASEFSQLIGTNIGFSAQSRKKEAPRVYNSSKELAMDLREAIDNYIMEIPYGDDVFVFSEDLAREYICSILKLPDNKNKIMNASRALRASIINTLGPRRLQVLVQLIENDPDLCSISEELCHSLLSEAGRN